MSSKAWWQDKLMVIKVTSIFWHPKPLDIAFVGVKVKVDLCKFTNNVVRMIRLWTCTQCNMRFTVFKSREVFTSVKMYNTIWIFCSKILDYPHLWRWLCRVYALPGVAESNALTHCKQGYFGRTWNKTIPAGPIEPMPYPLAYKHPELSTKR